MQLAKEKMIRSVLTYEEVRFFLTVSNTATLATMPTVANLLMCL